MTARAVIGTVTAVVLVALGCTPAALDPNGQQTTGGTTGTTGDRIVPGTDLVATLQGLAAEPGRSVIVGTNGGIVVRTGFGSVATFEDRDPGALTSAAAVAGLPVCSVEPQSLAFTTVRDAGPGLPTTDAMAFCASDDLGEMIDRLNGLKTPDTVAVIAANTAITVHSTNGGINYFYDDDIGRLLRTARRLYVAACVVAPESLSLPSPAGQTAGLSIDEALARCGR